MPRVEVDPEKATMARVVGVGTGVDPTSSEADGGSAFPGGRPSDYDSEGHLLPPRCCAGPMGGCDSASATAVGGHR